ncbi:MAG: DUF5666 domain-containing protein [Candidatus Doudnabacteria bacterium]
MTFEEFLKSKNFKTGFAAVVALIILIIVFASGMFVGLEKARFSYNWGTNYYPNFAGRPGPGGPFHLDRDFMNAHGPDGQIIKIDGNTITIKGRNGVEQNIIVDAQTAIKNNQANLKITDLKVNDNIVVIGSPDDEGQVLAKLIRVMPQAPM